MSQTMTIDAMALDLQARLPFNLTTAFCFTKLNQAYQWIEQQGAFVWDHRLAVQIIPQNQYWINLTGTSTLLPLAPDTINLAQIDVGKPIAIWPAGTTVMNVPIPFVPMDQFALYQTFNTTAIGGVFSVWTLLFSITNNCFQIRFAPTAAAVTDPGGDSFALQVHLLPVPPLTTGQFFPTPDQFDITIIDIAEVEIRRLYGLAGWDAALQKVQNSARALMDPYRSVKLTDKGLEETAKESQEAQLYRAQ